MTAPTDVLELEVIQQSPCSPNLGACMAIATTRASAMRVAEHVCGDPRASGARARVARLAADARASGFAGTITVHFPPGTFGAHHADANGQLVAERPARLPPGQRR